MHKSDTAKNLKRFRAALGPGFLFAGAAVGVSHLVQSTRAGAEMGLGLVGVIVLANLVKYVPFSFGPRYAASTGKSLLEGYGSQGKWALWIYAILTFFTMFTILATVSFVTAALVRATFSIQQSTLFVSAILMILCAILLFTGGFRWLDRIMKAVVTTLALMTIAAASLVIHKVDFSTFRFIPDLGAMDLPMLFFLAALIGWMPSAIDVSVWHSLWTLARKRSTGLEPTLKDSLLDFNVGYILTAMLSLCFVVMGAGIMFGSDQAISQNAAGFASQIINLYTSTLGSWSHLLIGMCAVLVMFSTTITVMDGFPRALNNVVACFRSKERDMPAGGGNGKGYWIALITLTLGSLVIIAFFKESLRPLVDLATTISFLTAPVLSWLNHRAVLGPEIPLDLRPGKPLMITSWLSILTQAAFAIWYLSLRFF